MWILQVFLSTMRSSPGKCPVDVILKPRIHLKIAANLYTHNPCPPYHPLMAATSLNGLLNPPKMTESQGPFHGLQTPQIKIWTCVYALTNQSCFGAMSRTYTILNVVADQCILDCHDILNRHSLIPDGDFCRIWRSPDNSSCTTTKSTFLRGNIWGFIG